MDDVILPNLKQTRAVVSRVAAKTGYPKWMLTLCYIQTICHTYASPHEFEALHLYEYPKYVRNQFLSFHRCIQISNRLIAEATPEDYAVIGEKHRFNTAFQKYIQREWLFIPDSSEDDIRAFIARNPVFLAKADISTQGQNIFLYRSDELDADTFLSEYAGKSFVLEAFIRQHPAMSSLNPSSVNTVRVVTAHYKGRTLIVGAGLRVGGAGEFVDNYHHGGLAFPIDLETGIVNGAGRNYEGECVLRHPATGRIVLGFEIPHWDELLRAASEAAGLMPRTGYLGWDVAVTEDGIEFIESNIDVPGPTVIQMDRPIAYGRLQRFFADCDGERK